MPASPNKLSQFWQELVRRKVTRVITFYAAAAFVIIIGLIALNLLGGRSGAKIDESLAKSIAVLPLLNLSGESKQEFICVGLTDDILLIGVRV